MIQVVNEVIENKIVVAKNNIGTRKFELRNGQWWGTTTNTNDWLPVDLSDVAFILNSIIQ